MKKFFIYLFALFIICFSLAGCSNRDYLQWTINDYNSASANEKLNCTTAYINKTLEQYGEEKFTDEEMDIYVPVIQGLLEDKLQASPSSTVLDLVNEVGDTNSLE